MRFQPSLFRNRVSRRVFYELIAFVFLPLGAMAYFGIAQVTSQLERQGFAQLKGSAKDMGMRIAERLHAVEFDVELLLGELTSAGARAPSGALSKPRANISEKFERCAVFLPQGALEYLGSGLGLPALTEAERDHLANGVFGLVVRPGAGGVATLLAVRNLDSFGLGAGTFVGELRTNALVPTELESRSFALLHGEDVILTTDAELVSEEALATLGSMDAATHFTLEGPPGTYLATRQTLFLHPQYGTNLTIVYAQPRSEIMAPVAYFRRVFVLAWGLTFQVALLISLRRIHKNLVPISILRDSTRRMASGDLGARVELEGNDEFKQLADSFNEMAESVRTRTQQLEEANSAKSRFLANMSHELRTPMTSILGYADLCGSDDVTPKAKRGHLEIIRTNGKHLLRIINDILDVSTIEANRLMIERQPCSPALVLDQAMGMIRVQAVAKGLGLSQRTLGPVPESISTDPDRLRQVLVNLLGNAVKFTERGHISVEMELVGKEAPDAGRCLAYVIRDTGPGMSPEVLAKLFRPFGQADDSMTRAQGGTGLGLSIARSIARLLGGDVICESSPGRGSTFRVTIDPGELEGIPLLDGLLALPAPAPPPPALEVAKGGRVLVVEDVAVNRVLAVRLLRKAGLVVDEAENGAIAVTKALAEPYSVIFMDIQMPVLDGFEATRRLRSAGYTGAIVALTAHSVAGEREKCLEAGCDDHLAKPIDLVRLQDTLTRWMGEAATAAPAIPSSLPARGHATSPHGSRGDRGP